MVRRVETTGDGAILYDDALLSHPDPALFEPDYWPGAAAAPHCSLPTLASTGCCAITAAAGWSAA